MRRVGIRKSGCVFDLLPGTLIDTAGNNTVTNNGATLTADHNGRSNRGWSFDGVDDKLSTSASIDTLLTESSTYVVGFKWDGDTSKTFQTIFSNRSSDGSKAIVSTWTANTLRISSIIGGVSLSKSVVFTDTNWHFLSIVRNSGVLSCYLDMTELVGTDTVAIGTGTGFAIGCRQDNTRFWGGKIDYFDGYTRALNISEIQKLYNHWSSH